MYYGVTGKIPNWIAEFSHNRVMRVGVHGSFSEWAAVLSCISQGSVLGALLVSLLFLIFINNPPD